ncbi:polymer-forming cytoskeletal protein [Phenylobacterium sp.]|uniref:bactofilin family protein n=1 Tax=Phenylobacterium sp. TaxID=1871053 RepID=UPI0035B10B26
MFSKAAKTDKAPELSTTVGDAARKAPKAASLISQDLTVEGAIVGEGELHLDGVIRGDVRVGRLTLGDTGHVEGAIQAETVDVRGRVIGSITAKQVRLYGTAYVDGDITHEQLSVETGAFFQGRSLKFQRPAPVALAAPEPEAQSA